LYVYKKEKKMSFLITPVLNYTVHLAISSVGNVISYAGSGAWWLTKRAIWGPPPPTTEELILQQQKEILKTLDKQPTADSQHELLQAMEQQISQQAQLIQVLEKRFEMIQQNNEN
jgi:hypothetical protein